MPIARQRLLAAAQRTLIVLAALAVVAAAWWPALQTMADAVVDQGLRRALISFTTARGLNGVISVVQSTQLSVQPLGFGLTVTLGEVLDPINDLVEQFSTLMLWASLSFGVQKAVLLLSGHWALSALVTALAMVWAAAMVWGRCPAWLSRSFIVVFLVRFALPLATVGTEWVFTRTFAPEYAAEQKAVEGVSARMGELAKQSGPAPGVVTAPESEPATKGIFERMKERVTGSLPSLRNNYDAVKKAAEELPERLVRLMVIFLMQTLVLPLLFLWILWRVVGAGAKLHAPPALPRLTG